MPSESDKAYWAGVRTWAEGGSIQDLPQFLKASHRTIERFGRDVNEHKRKLEAGVIVPQTIRAIPKDISVRG